MIHALYVHYTCVWQLDNGKGLGRVCDLVCIDLA